MIRELDVVTLTRDLEEHRLKKGAHGTVVHCYPAGTDAYEVEFFDDSRQTIGVFTIRGGDLRVDVAASHPVQP
jgi:hypothetical protein